MEALFAHLRVIINTLHLICHHMTGLLIMILGEISQPIIMRILIHRGHSYQDLRRVVEALQGRIYNPPTTRHAHRAWIEFDILKKWLGFLPICKIYIHRGVLIPRKYEGSYLWILHTPFEEIYIVHLESAS